MWTGRLPTPWTWLSERLGLSRRISIVSVSFTFSQAAGLGLVALLLVRAISQDISISRENLGFENAGLAHIPDVVAANWVRLHTDPKDVIAARHVPLVFHHAQRRVIWFAPIVRPQVMMEGVRRLNIRYIIVVDRENSYYLPPDSVCFDMVERAYPSAFHLAAELGKARIYEVMSAGMGATASR
jgi:hypothetical protein